MRSLRLDMNSPPSGAGLRNQQNKSSINEEPVQFTLQKQPQSLQVLPGQVVCWERFLPLRTLKVLLVENDDSTRHVVSALLRNCSYEVTAVANGVEAWKVLEDLSNRIDLVLTEVDMPSLSGIGLLSKITNHRTCSNIPVIMMSSNDSMGVVFTCLSKGATDFLVKPIRKNELKNLWQHVWRKCHSSSGSGSGSESGIRTQKSTKSKSVEGSKNDLESNDEDDNGSFGLNARDGSDNGSGTQTQSCWSKRALEIESPQEMSPWDEQSDPTNSTNAQVNQSSSEMLQNNNQADTRKRQKLDNQHDKAAMSKDKESKGKTDVIMGGTEKEKPINLESEENRNKLEKGKIDLNHEAPNELLNNSPEPDLDPEDTTTDLTTLQVENVSKQGPSLELTLKQTGDVSLKLRHSGISAFSRYNKSNVTTTNLAPTGSCSPVDKSPEAGKIDNLISNSSGAPNARSNGSSNNNDMGSTTNPEKVVADRSIIPKSTVNNINANLTLQPVTESPPTNANNQKIQVQHHHHHYHHHHHHVHNMQQQQQQQVNGEGLSTMEEIIAKDPNRVQSENVFAVNAEGNANNYGSASGSNNGSDQNGSSGKNGSSTAIDATEGINVTSDNGEAGQAAPGIGIGRSVADQNRIAWREAALNKFQQKRKERCFEKKVRYQSRKKLAEQRPRVRGQFVRQTADENKRSEKTNDADR